MKIDKFVIRLFLWLILLIFIIWLLYMAIVPTGRVSYVYDFKEQSYFITKLTPAERLKPIKDSSQEIVADPIYFSLRTPRTFDKARLSIEFKNESPMPLAEVGVLADKQVWRYQTKPLQNKIIDELSKTWQVNYQNSLVLLQRKQEYKSIAEFLQHPPLDEKIALYNYDLKRNYLLPDYQKSSSQSVINQPLRGAYQFYTYIKDENLDFKFRISDLNKNKNPDPAELRLYKDNQLIATEKLNDDGIVIDNGEQKETRELQMRLSDLPEGVYKLELLASDDIITERIETKQQKLAFINKLWLADDGSKNLDLITDSQTINAQTVNPAKLQTAIINNQKLPIDETYKQFSLVVDKDRSSITLAKDDVIISGDGVFSFNPEQFIEPNLKKITANSKISGIDYILADYKIPAATDGWQTATVDLDLKSAYREKGSYSFLISIPGLKTGDKGGVIIRNIKVELEGTTLMDKIKKMITNR